MNWSSKVLVNKLTGSGKDPLKGQDNLKIDGNPDSVESDTPAPVQSQDTIDLDLKVTPVAGENDKNRSFA